MSRTREQQIEGIRQLADWLEANLEIPIPWHLDPDAGYISIHASRVKDQKALLATFARMVPGKVSKRVYGEDGPNPIFEVEGYAPGGIRIGVLADRDEVCERIVTGTHEVVEKVPHPDAPMIEVTRTVEDVEWVCGSVLAGAK